MSVFGAAELRHVIGSYGYWAVGGIVGLESMGVPLPGETTLVAAGIYAGATHHLSVLLIVVAAAVGAIAGDNAGFWIGRSIGYRLVLRYGRWVRLTESRVKLGQYLFLRHGGKIVFFGRFVAVLRALAAFLSGVNCMEWPRFLAFNAAGGIVWAAAYGAGSYYLGKEVERIAGPTGVVLGAAAAAGAAAAIVLLRRHEGRLEAAAERALPGPLPPASGKCAQGSQALPPPKSPPKG